MIVSAGLRSRILSCWFLLACFLAAYSARALEGFSFVGKHALKLDEPTHMLVLGNRSIVIHDESSRAFVFYDAAFKETSRVSLDAQLGYSMKSPEAIIFDTSREQIFALDAKRKLIHVFRSDGNLARSIDLNIDRPVRLSDPSAMAIDGSGRIFIGDEDEDNIKVFSMEGMYLFSLQIRPTLKDSKPSFEPTDMVVLPDGSLAVLETDRRCLQTFSRRGFFPARRLLEGEYRRLAKLIATRAGEFISFDSREQKIYKWNSAGKLTGLFGTKGTGRGGFRELVDIACDREGNILTLDRDSREIQIFAFQTPAIPLEGSTPSPLYSVSPRSADKLALRLVAMLPQALIYFDSAKKEVHTRSGEDHHIFKNDEFKDISTAHMSPDRLYLFDRSRRKVYAFRTDDQQLDFEFGRARGNSGLDDVVRILPGSEGTTLYLADTGDTKIKVFSKDGIFATSFGTRGKKESAQIGHLSDMAWFDEKLAVLDDARKMIHLYDANGRLINNIRLRLPSAKAKLTSLTTDPNGFLMVLDERNATVYVVDKDGEITFTFGSGGKRNVDWRSPESFMIDADGILRLFDAGPEARLLTYAVRTPGTLSQVEAAIAANYRVTVEKGLEPYLAALRAGNLSPSSTHGRAMQLAVRADTRFAGTFMTDTLRHRAEVFLRDYLKRNPGEADVRIALAEDLTRQLRTEEAIALLSVDRKEHRDARCEALLSSYREELEESGRAKSVVSISDCKVPVMLAALCQNYYDTPVIKLTLSNKGGKPTSPGKALFLAKAIMDNPTETPVPALEPFSSITVDLRATLNRDVLTYVEATRIAGQVQVQFDNGSPDSKPSRNVGFQLMGRNAIDWKQQGMISCFIMPNDPDIQLFSSRALKTAEGETIQADMDEHLYKALTLFDAVQSVGIFYTPDPTQPFNFSKFSGEGLIDSVQFPRETLMRQSGDCDDLSVLYASLLEGVGIPTLLVTTPGHIFVAFALKNADEAVDSLGLSRDLLLEYKGEQFVPVETVLLGGPFITAWRVAANTVTKYRATDEIGFIDLSEARKEYKTVSLPPHNQKVPVPVKSSLGILLKRELGALNLKQVEKRLAVYKEWLVRDPDNVNLLILLARTYGEVGIFGVAHEYADRAMKLDTKSTVPHQVLGNLAFMQNDYVRATDWYLKADKLEHTAGIQINLALSYLKNGQLVAARRAYAEAKKLGAELAGSHPELAQLLE